MKKSIILFVILLSCSCKQNPPKPTELYSKYRNSVALIANSYYFKTSLDNGLEFFYTIENDKPVFFDDEIEATENASLIFGTGFFISDKGELATNRHVVYPNKKDELVGEGINEYLDDLRYKIMKAINDEQTEQSKLADLWHEYYDYLDYEQKSQLRDEYSNKNIDILELEQLLEMLDFNPDNTQTVLKRVFLGIAFEDTYVTSINDFKECVAIKRSSEDAIDLAIIQLKDKRTPQHIANVFSLESTINAETPKLNDNVYMIGFNHGISLATTDYGIKSQFTQGTITQDPDNSRILYSIPTLPGSSGSPIVDKWGNLIAINFAKIEDFQGFSFGIPSYQLANLYKNASYVDQEPLTVKSNISTKNKIEESSNRNLPKSDSYYQSEIRSLLEAEDQRDFNQVIKYYDLKKMKRYWDHQSPSYDDLSKAYFRSWNLTSSSSNKINTITKEWERIFVVNLDFTFYNTKKQEWKTVNSKVRFVFGENDKIIEVYGIN